MSDTLKPCPFCGHVPSAILPPAPLMDAYRIVHRCKVIPPFMIEGETEKAVVSKWNTRFVMFDAELKGEDRR